MAMLTLAVAIGAMTATLSVVDTAVLQVVHGAHAQTAHARM
jgi:hypothetical protein